MNFKRRQVTRRRLLSGAAAGAIGAPFAGMVRRSQAGGSLAPRRMFLILSPNGMGMPDWVPTGTPDNWNLSRILEPLQPHKDDIIVLDGVDNEAAHYIAGEGGASFHTSISSMWNGTIPESGSGGFLGTGITVDQYIGSRIDETIFPSLEAGVMPHNEAFYKTRMCYSGPGSFVQPETDPYALLDRVFGSIDPGASDEEIERLRAQRQSIIGSVRGDLVTLESERSGNDRIKIQEHLVALQALEDQMDGAGCAAPRVPPGMSLTYNSWHNLPTAIKVTMDILVAALQCDATRVVSMHITDEVSNAEHDFLDLGVGETRHHVLSHAYPGGSEYDAYVNVNRWHAELVAYLVESLKSIPEGDGTLLDNTVVVWASNLSKGWRHEARNIPIVLAGSCGGYFETGKWHKWGNYDLEQNSHDPHGGRTMNDLLISLCHAMGFDDVDTFGDPAFCTGPLL